MRKIELLAALGGVDLIALVLDGRGRVTFANDYLLRVLGVRREEVLGQDWFERFLPADEQKSTFEIFCAFLAGGGARTYENEVVTGTGERRLFRWHNTPVLGDAGRVVGAASIGEDITDRRRSEEETKQLQERLVEAQRIAHLGNWDWNVAADTLWWSDEIYRIFGLSPQQFGATYEAFLRQVHPDDRKAVTEAVERALRKEAEYAVDHRIIRPDGTVRSVRERGEITWDAAGKPLRMLGTVHDVTEQEERERERTELLSRERAAREEAERASRAKDVFLAMLSHELRTPLASILTWTQVLRRTPGNAERVRYVLERIERSAWAQKHIVDDLLDVSQIISGKIPLERRAVDPVAVLNAALESIAPLAEEKSIRFETVVEPTIGSLEGDFTRLQQVFWNLLSNAIKFSTPGATVKIHVGPVPTDRVRIEVADTGAGFPPEFAARIFEPFAQADPSITRAHGGLGLGLAIAHDIVEAHGGTIAARSAGPGKGASAEVELPLFRGPAPVTEPESTAVPASDSLENLSVLVIDDESQGLEAVGAALGALGAKVSLAGSTREGLASIAREKPDVIVCDLAMPLEDGFTFVRKLRGLPPAQGGELPVLALTAYADHETRTRALASGFAGYLSKPVRLEALVRQITRLRPAPSPESPAPM